MQGAEHHHPTTHTPFGHGYRPRRIIIIIRAVGAPVHGKDVVNGLNTRYKRMVKLEMENIIKSELICDDPNF